MFSPQEAEVAERNAAVSAVLHEPRVSPRGQLVVAEWDEGRGAAVVRKFAGKHWEALGHSESVVSLGQLFVISGFISSLRTCVIRVSVIFKSTICTRITGPSGPSSSGGEQRTPSGGYVDGALAGGGLVSRRV